MNDASLTRRYIHAATRGVAERGRTDLRAELEASIADAIDARVRNGESPAVAERAVLIDMGDPDRLAADYTDRPAYLIGPRYYFDWLRLVRMLLAIVLPIALVGVATGQLIAQVGIGELIGGLVTAGLTIALHLVFWPTLVFAILERSSASSTGVTAWTLDRLPEVRPKGLSVADLVASLVLVALMIVALLWDRFVGFVFVDGAGVPVLNPALWQFWVPLLLVVLVGEAVFAVVLHRTGRWTVGLALVNALLAVAFAVPVIWLIVQGELLNPAFFAAAAAGDAAEVASIVSFVVACTAVAAALGDVIDGAVKTARTRA